MHFVFSKMNIFRIGDFLFKWVMFLLFLLFTGLMGILWVKRRKQDNLGYWPRDKGPLLWSLTSGSEWRGWWGWARTDQEALLSRWCAGQGAAGSVGASTNWFASKDQFLKIK